jgi:hypothetical protein
MFTAVVIALMILWIIAIVSLMLSALGAFEDGDGMRGMFYGAAVLLLFAVPLGVALEADESGGRLCARGHQEWRTSTALVLAGKVVMPTSSRRKTWVCDAWAIE